MKLKKILAQLTTLLALLIFSTGFAHASPYGSGAYGECLYDGEAGACDIIDPSATSDDEQAAEDTEDEEPATDEEPAPTDSFDDSVPPAVSAVDPLDDGGLGMAPVIGAIAALIGAALLVFWAHKRRSAPALVTPPAPTFTPAPPVQPTPPPQPQPVAAPEPETDPTAKTDVNLIPSSTGVTTAAGEAGQPAEAEQSAATGPTEPETEAPQAGQVVSPQTTQQHMSENSEDYVMPANTPPEMIDRPTTGVSHKDIHGPGQ